MGSQIDMKTDILWGTFAWKDEQGEVQFQMPINPGDFEIGKDYKITFTKYETI